MYKFTIPRRRIKSLEAPGVSDNLKQLDPESSFIMVLKDTVDLDEALARFTRDQPDLHIKRVYRNVLRGFMVTGRSRLVRSLDNSDYKYIEKVKPLRSDVHGSSVQEDAEWGLDRISQRDLPLDGNYVVYLLIQRKR
jgi:hypothetical protein